MVSLWGRVCSGGLWARLHPIERIFVLALLCSPSARPPRAEKGLSARLCSYAKFHRSWRARLRGAQSSRFGGCFELLARLQVESKHNLKTGRLSWAIAPNTRVGPASSGEQTQSKDGPTQLGHCSKHKSGLILPGFDWPQPGHWAAPATTTLPNPPVLAAVAGARIAPELEAEFHFQQDLAIVH
jgi:hypothetical protein